jgi:hypothetical protein
VEGQYKDTLKPIPSWFIYIKPEETDDSASVADNEVDSSPEKEGIVYPAASTWTETLGQTLHQIFLR